MRERVRPPGGAPRHLHAAREQRRDEVVVGHRTQLVLLVDQLADLLGDPHAALPFAERGVEVVCSLPHYRARGTDAQRGDGTYEKSIKALRRLNAVGYGQGDPKRQLTLMSNPSGAFLAGDQARLEAEWKAALLKNHQVSFDRLFCLNNMPISRFLEWLVEKGNLEAYMERLTNAFNPGAVGGLMCRNTLSISWDGRVFDCDFNQMLDMDIHLPNGDLGTIHEFDFARFQSRRVRTDRHCFGCTAGSGSSCGGATT
mgnify:CR=1 FL=1